MKLEDQCVSLDLAKKLKELGVKQESIFYWRPRLNQPSDEDLIWDFCPTGIQTNGYDANTWYSAFSCAELGDMLISNESIVEYMGYDEDKNKTFNMYTKGPDIGIRSNSEANARALMLIHLIENGLVKIEDINNGT